MKIQEFNSKPGDLILVTNQIHPHLNGVYKMLPNGNWARFVGVKGKKYLIKRIRKLKK